MNKVFVFLLFFISLGIYPRESLSVESKYLDVYFEEKEEGGYIFYGDNSHFVPIFVNLGFTSLSNLDMDVENPAKVVIPPGSKGVEILELTPKRDDLGYSFRSRLTHGFGDPFNTEPDNWIYVFPYAHGTKYRVDQGYGGTFSHRGENYYSLDFPMGEGSEVYAARGGVVIDVKEDSNIGGPTQQYGDYGNYITIYHLDGTYASYVHLIQNGSLVEVGGIVEEGALIGYSGNTGLSTGPHLHFSVSKTNLDGKRESIPVKFLDHLAMEVEPQVGEYYYANHRGKEPFEYFFGKDLIDTDFENYIKTINQTDKLEIRYETVDDTTIVYCANGNARSVTGKFTIRHNNTISTKKSPITVEIPPLSEVYICIIRPKDSKRNHSFSTSVSYVLN